MEFLHFILNDYRLMSGIFIGSATLSGVTLNILYNKRLDRNLKREKTASIASAVASELLYNSYNLRKLYLEIQTQKSKNPKVTEYRQIDTQVYQELLEQLGELGSSLTFMVVDAYGDIKKVKGRMEVLTSEGKANRTRDKILQDIQFALVKTLSCSLTMYLYADYMNGAHWMKKIQEQRIIRIKRTIEGFCNFVEKTEREIEFISSKEDSALDFKKRFLNKEDRANIKALMDVVEHILKSLPRYKLWRVQLALRAFSYKIQNTLTEFLDIEPDEYDVLSEQEYGKFL